MKYCLLPLRNWPAIAEYCRNECEPREHLNLAGTRCPHPLNYPGFVQSGGVPKGQIADYRLSLPDGTCLHVQHFPDGARLCHWDEIDPKCDHRDAILHSLIDAPITSILASGALGWLLGVAQGDKRTARRFAERGLAVGAGAVLLANADRTARKRGDSAALLRAWVRTVTAGTFARNTTRRPPMAKQSPRRHGSWQAQLTDSHTVDDCLNALTRDDIRDGTSADVAHEQSIGNDSLRQDLLDDLNKSDAAPRKVSRRRKRRT